MELIMSCQPSDLSHTDLNIDASIRIGKEINYCISLKLNGKMKTKKMILEEIKGLRKDMNQQFQALQVLLSEHLKSTNDNYQQNNITLEHDDSIQTQTSNNEVVNIDSTMKKLQTIENCETLEGNIQLSHCERLYQGQHSTTGSNEETEKKLELLEQLETPDNKMSSSKNLDEENCAVTEYRQETGNPMNYGENKLTLLINGVGRNIEVPDFNYSPIPSENYLKSSFIGHVKNNCKEVKQVQFNKSIISQEAAWQSMKLAEDRVFKCEYCRKGFKYPSLLKIHLKIHTGEKSFQCQICLKTFTQSGILQSHVRTHTGEKPFKCEVCSKTFAQMGNLKSHSRIHTGEKPFKCQFCHKAFTQSGHLQSHAVIHTGK